MMVNQKLAAALAASVLRVVMVYAGAHGVELGDEQQNAALGWLEQGFNGALILVPLIWSAIHKVKVDKAINATADVA